MTPGSKAIWIVNARQHFNSFLAEQLSVTGNDSIASMGAQWGNYALWYALQFDPDYVAAQVDELHAANDPVATDPMCAGTTYFFAHSYRTLGRIQPQFHMSIPTSAVYFNTNNGRFTYVAWNPRATNEIAIVYSNNLAVGNIVLPPRTLTTANSILADGTPLSVLSTSPSGNQMDVPIDLSQVQVSFNQPVSGASVSGANMVGPGVTGLSNAKGDNTPVITFQILARSSHHKPTQ